MPGRHLGPYALVARPTFNPAGPDGWLRGELIMWYEINLPAFLLGSAVTALALVGIVAFLIDFFMEDDE
jgi:hypothetical protein